MRQDRHTSVLDYAPRPRARPVRWGWVMAAGALLLLLNVLPHFRTTVGAHTADLPEPEFGWPWVFYFTGYSIAGPGPFFEPIALCFDIMLGTGVLVSTAMISRRSEMRCDD